MSWKSSNVLATGNPQSFLYELYGGRPASRPRIISIAGRSDDLWNESEYILSASCKFKHDSSIDPLLYDIVDEGQFGSFCIKRRQLPQCNDTIKKALVCSWANRNYMGRQQVQMEWLITWERGCYMWDWNRQMSLNTLRDVNTVMVSAFPYCFLREPSRIM